jgi:hypothetical protein
MNEWDADLHGFDGFARINSNRKNDSAANALPEIHPR